jgi:hypothetical protein
MAWSQSAALHDVAPRRARSPRPTPRVRTSRQPTTRRSMRSRTAVPARSLGATCFASTGRSAAVPAPRRPTNRAPPYTPHVAAAHSRRTPAMLQPIPGLASTWCPSHRLNRLVHNYKAGQSILARAPSRRRPPWVPHGELHPRLLSLANTCCFPLHRTPPVAPARACWSARAASSPEGCLPRPPLDSRRRALLPARLPSQPTTLAHPLDPSEAARATHWPVPSPSSPEFERPRPRHHRSATAARLQHPGPILRHPSTTGEPNRLPRRSFAYPCTPLPPASSSSPSVHGGEDLIAKALKLPGTRVLKDSILFDVL